MNDEQIAEISNAPVELSGSDMDRLLIEDYKLTEFQLLVAKSHTVGLPPYNARNFLIYSHTFDRIKRDFCKKHGVLPVGEVGEYIIIVISDPFNLKTTSRIQEMTHMNVVALLALERENMEHLDEDTNKDESVGFGDVVETLGMEFDIDEEGIDEASAPIIQLTNRIIEEAFVSGAIDIHVEPFEKQMRTQTRVEGVCHERLTFRIR